VIERFTERAGLVRGTSIFARICRRRSSYVQGDPVFAAAGACAYRHDLPDAEIHVIDAGHFALETNVVKIACLMRTFFASFGMTSASQAR
jgi:hypothetical protein